MTQQADDMLILRVKDGQEDNAPTILSKVLFLVGTRARLTWDGGLHEIALTVPCISADVLLGWLLPALGEYLAPKIIVRGIDWHRNQLAEPAADLLTG